jgi:hypothetical protein
MSDYLKIAKSELAWSKDKQKKACVAFAFLWLLCVNLDIEMGWLIFVC